MKRLFITSVLVLAAICSAGAQGVAFIKTDSILAVIPEYKEAQDAIKAQADKYRAELEADLKTIDDIYTAYQSQKQYLTASARNSRENQIIRLEDSLKEKQEKYFGAGGEMEKMTTAMLTPIKERVNGAVKAYAQEKGYTMVMDMSMSATVVYYDGKADITAAIIERLK